MNTATVTRTSTKADQVQAAVHTLLEATDFTTPELARELDQARKRDVGAYLSALAAGLDRLTSLVGAAVDQVDQFTGSTEEIDDVEDRLGDAHNALTDLAFALHPETA